MDGDCVAADGDALAIGEEGVVVDELGVISGLWVAGVTGYFDGQLT